jgi:hypothetical protein
MSDKINIQSTTRLWRLSLWPIGAIHFGLTRSKSGASLVIGIFIWKLAFHVSIAALD